MKPALCIAILAAVLPLLPAPAAALHVEQHVGSGVVERSVSFEVVNRNRSETSRWCDGDGKSYTVRGSLVGPAGVDAGRLDAVTVYLPGGGDASSWHFTAVAGVDHVSEMARLGHASVFVHLLGYGTSDLVDGFAVCLGAHADHIGQVIGQLRSGSYTVDGRTGPAFERVALAGHSVAANIAELTEVSFRVTDALIVSGWTGYGYGAKPPEELVPPGPTFYTSLAGAALRCATAPEPKRPGGPGGWAWVFATRAEREMLFHDVDGQVLDAFVDLFERDPCGWGGDLAAAQAATLGLTPTVDVPVLLAHGDRDPVVPTAVVELQRSRYALGGADVSSLIVPETGHMIMLERPAPAFRAGLSHWLANHGF